MKSIKRLQKLPLDSNNGKSITEKLVQFIFLDSQPLSVVENVGFRCLIEHLEPCYTLPSHHYMKKAIPHMYNEVCDFLSKPLVNVGTVSFTTNIWSSDVSPMFLLSLTMHWIDSDFTLKKVVLHANGIPLRQPLRKYCVNGRWIKTKSM